MERTHSIALTAALAAGLFCAAAAGQPAADPRERMRRMAADPTPALAGPATGWDVEVGPPAGDADPAPLESTPLAPRTAASREAEALPSAGSGGSSLGGYALPTLAALGVVVGLLYGLKAVAAKVGGVTPARPSPAVEVLSRTGVGPKSQVLLVRVGARVLVVGDSAAGGLRTLAEAVDEAEVAELLRSTAAAPAGGFQALLASVGSEKADAVEDPPARAPDPLAGVKARLERLGGRA
ncbi:FliO/MopB family protein [Phycisphaera mikurensis]|uniref:Flagellar biosynthetic protein FliO n=1 Tax=Phycisphaera mikurensis (strain NBRC 102666 / KCTC 22515 / FYK2301M01) TaxID=1142394 RepID=I0IGX4_PHYMF|nr:flagellar biosynthetic protein FliO [Phycisphaera mikurensis]MBB6440769.1 flagellar biogenesis protein FliO [Phycisphaera mikurensis]BAM04512.1 hypothetical protein PSMK_23530 [Phycisphaera mikurensis NBRC 102666]